jgi:hypothetical protein
MIFYEVAVLVKHLDSDYKGRRSIKILDVPSMEIIEEYIEGTSNEDNPSFWESVEVKKT